MSGSLLDTAIGPDAVRVTVAGAPLSLTATGPVVIRHGRSGPFDPPSPATCTLTVDANALAAAPQIGAEIAVQLGTDALNYAGLGVIGEDANAFFARDRFLGDVTDVAIDPPREVGGSGTVRIVATSRLARLGRQELGALGPYDQETDALRALHILLDAELSRSGDVSYTTGGFDPGDAELLADPDPNGTAANALDSLAAQTGGALVQLRTSGALEWHGAEHRRDPVLYLTLPAAAILADVTARRQLATLVNVATISYGAGSAKVILTDEGSVTTHGPAPVSISTELAYETDAENRALSTLGRRSEPSWELDALEVDLLRTVNPATAGLLWLVEQGDLIAFDYPVPQVGINRAYVEGWTETISRHGWRLALTVSDERLTRPPERWSDIHPAVTWADIPADASWFDLTYALPSN